jgi:hypothetical protein
MQDLPSDGILDLPAIERAVLGEDVRLTAAERREVERRPSELRTPN